MPPRSTRNVTWILILILCICTSISIRLAAANIDIMVINGASFSFGWSANTGENWLLNTGTTILNNKGLTAPSPTPISSDAGSSQTNTQLIYLNNLGFSYGWGTQTYTPSNSMSTDIPQTLNNKGPNQPSSTSTSGDAGISQQNPIMIYLNGASFSFGWTPNTSDRYAPSSTTEAGSPAALNPKGLSQPVDEPIIPEYPSLTMLIILTSTTLTLVFTSTLSKRKRRS